MQIFAHYRELLLIAKFRNTNLKIESEAWASCTSHPRTFRRIPRDNSEMRRAMVLHNVRSDPRNVCPSGHGSVHIRRRRLANPTRSTRRDNGQRPLVTFWTPIRGERGRAGETITGADRRPLSKFIQTRDPIPIQYFSGRGIGYERTHILPFY